MRTPSRSRLSLRLLTAPLVLGVSVSVGCFSADSSVEGRTPFTLTSDEVAGYEGNLTGLLSNPCDEVPSDSNNEIHDCQRFVFAPDQAEPDTIRFGSLIGIFPNPAVMALGAEDFAEPQLAAYITNAGGNEHYPDLGYPPLHVDPKPTGAVEPGQYCLWLRWDLAGSSAWQAAIIPNTGYDFAQEELGCGNRPLEGAWNSLSVVRRIRMAPSFGYPPTARWAWTEPNVRHAQEYIEIRCGEGSCGITPTGVTLPASLPPGQERHSIPGWYDAQFLAVYDPDSLAVGDSVLVPGPWGVVYPEMRPQPPSASSSGWELAARVELTGDPGPYDDKFLLNSSHSATIYFNMDDSGVPMARWDNGTEQRENAVITGAGGHGPHGATRWRWHPDDEGVWIPCYYWGCCEPEMGG